MTLDQHDAKRHSLDDDQEIDARQALGCGLSAQQVAQYFGLSESELRTELGMPQRKAETSDDRQRTLFDNGGDRDPNELTLWIHKGNNRSHSTVFATLISVESCVLEP